MTEDLFSRNPWPHQRRGVEQTIESLEGGAASVCLTSPTGSGKTDMAIALAKWAEAKGETVLCLTNRILLTEQTRGVFQNKGIGVGVISASMKWAEREDAQVQIATIQTIQARIRKQPSYWVDADLVLVDEVHQCSTGESADLLNAYRRSGAKVVGITATPLGVSNVCSHLIVAGRTRDLQKDGILCTARWFAPSELDTRKLVKGRVDLSLTETDARKTWGPLRGDDHVRTRIVGNIIDNYRSLHPELTHTLAFAPGVKESVWAARFCQTKGIRSLHVDGDEFIYNGKTYDRKKHNDIFEEARQAWREGDVPILWNRFVLREGIDEPQIRCILLATPVGSYRSFLQMVGRGLRTHHSKETCLVIDFGGCLDTQSEILTKRGWLGIDEIADSDIIGTMNLKTNSFEWCQNEGTIRKKSDSEMIAVRPGTPHLDFRVTGYHEMVMTPDNRNCKWRKQRARTLADRKSVCQVPVSLIEDVPPCELTDSEITFIGWFLTDGGMDSNGCRVRIYQAASSPQEHHDSIVGCLDKCGFRYSVRRRTRPTRFGGVSHEVSYTVASGKKSKGGYNRLAEWLDKLFPLDVFERLDRRQFGVLLHAMNLGDGCKHNGYNQNTVTLAVAPRIAADNIQSLAIRRGYRCNMAIQTQNGDGIIRKQSTIHLLHIRDTQHAHIMPGTLVNQPAEQGEYVWCVQTANGTLICRRNGRVCVMGNSWWRHGSVNVNVEWEDVFDYEDPDLLSKKRVSEQRELGEPMGQVCPKCGMVHKHLSRLITCQYCGYELTLRKPSRPILQADGTLTQVTGEPISQWKFAQQPGDDKLWESLYHNGRNKGYSFAQVDQQFFYKKAQQFGSNGRPNFAAAYHPERTMRNMPRHHIDWWRPCDKVTDLT